MDTILVRDLELSLASYREFYEITRKLRENYADRMRRGAYDSRIAIKGMRAYVDTVLKSDWFKQVYGEISLPSDLERNAIAKNLMEHYEEEIRDMSKSI